MEVRYTPIIFALICSLLFLKNKLFLVSLDIQIFV